MAVSKPQMPDVLIPVPSYQLRENWISSREAAYLDA